MARKRTPEPPPAGQTEQPDFESNLLSIKHKIDELKALGLGGSPQIEELERQHERTMRYAYENLTPWQEVIIARKPNRPQTRDYVDAIFPGFMELHGDRRFRDDAAIVAGPCWLGDRRIMLVGQHKGRNTEESIRASWGCPHPEGYWKALHKMRLAEKFGLPVVTLVDTKGAFPGIGAEERGVAIAIAENLQAMAGLRVPIVCIIIGEGGSGGALGICVGDRVLMLQHAWYSVISPEGCAAILWRNAQMKAQAAAALKLTSRHLREFEIVDEIVPEPLGGAHIDQKTMAATLASAIERNLADLDGVPIDTLLEERYQRLRRIGEFTTGQTRPEPKPEEPEAPEGEAETPEGDASAQAPAEALAEATTEPPTEPENADEEETTDLSADLPTLEEMEEPPDEAKEESDS